MWTAERVVEALRSRGEVWTTAPGLVGMRGETLALFRALERRVAAEALAEAPEEWRFPAAIPLETLARAEYFASFPQWLTAASHLSADPVRLEEVATSPRPAEAARAALDPAEAALPPAVCYHAYAALSGRTLDASIHLSAQGTCWRHEGDRLRPLERDWAFTMREAVCLGSDGEVEAFRRRGMERARALAESLGMRPEIAPASDPFFAPTARGKALLQRVKGLKHELLLPIGGGRLLAAASFNHHEGFFGEAFDIRLADGSPAASGCVAFGVERWLLAFLVAHGPEPRGWPDPLAATLLQEA